MSKRDRMLYEEEPIQKKEIPKSEKKEATTQNPAVIEEISSKNNQKSQPESKTKKRTSPNKGKGRLKNTSLQTFNLTADVVDRMENYVNEKGVSKSQVVREAIKEYMERHGS